MHVTADGTGLQLVFTIIIPVYLLSEIFPGVSRGPTCSSCTKAYSPVWPPLTFNVPMSQRSSSSINPAIRLSCACSETAASVYGSAVEILNSNVSCSLMSCIFMSCYFMSCYFTSCIYSAPLRHVQTEIHRMTYTHTQPFNGP